MIMYNTLMGVSAGLGGIMSVTWPLNVNPPINILFGEPCMFLGLLLIAAAVFLGVRREAISKTGSTNKKESDEAFDYLMKVLRPVSWVIFGLGLILLACTFAIVRFELVGAAPPFEPFTGLLHEHPVIENTFFAILYGLPAIGTLLFPWALRSEFGGTVTKVVIGTLMATGILFLLFSAMNYYTHIGMLVNDLRGTNYRF